jgi:hypothetical protein
MEDTSKFAYSTLVSRKKRKSKVGCKPPVLNDLVDRAQADIESNGWMTACLGWEQTSVFQHYIR